MYFGAPFQKPLWEGPRANLSSKIGFGAVFRISWDPQIDPWSDIFDQKGAYMSISEMNPLVQESIWARFGAETVPREAVSLIWGRFW